MTDPAQASVPDSPFPHDVRMRGFRVRTPVEAVQALLDARLAPGAAEDVGLREAAGRVLAADVTSPVAVPPFDRAAMDGYALRGDETVGAAPDNPVEFEVIGIALPGRSLPVRVGRGQSVRIMTGAPMPSGADAVVPAEAAGEVPGDQGPLVRVTGAVAPGRHVGRRGEDVAEGATVLRAGRVLRPQDVGVLASIGAASVRVVRRPRVAVLVTGDELLPPGSRPGGWRIVDSNSVMLEALVRRDGGEPATGRPLPDDPRAIRAALLEATAEVILVTGGSSVGQEDHAPRVLAELGELAVHGVALRPAGPAGVGFLGGRPVFLLPGNPVSCLCAYDLFAGRAVRRLGSRDPELPYRTRLLPLGVNVASAVGRVDYVRVALDGERVVPVTTGGAGILSTTTRALGFVLVPGEKENYPAGEMVTVYLYDERDAGGAAAV